MRTVYHTKQDTFKRQGIGALRDSLFFFRDWMLQNVISLSDDEGGPGAVLPAEPQQIVAAPRRKRKSLPAPDPLVAAQELSGIRQDLARIVSSNCYCYRKSGLRRWGGSCFRAFQQKQLFGDLLALRSELQQMTKEDSDKKVL